MSVLAQSGNCIPEPERAPGRLLLARRLCRWLPPILAARLGASLYPQARAFADDCPFTVKAMTGSEFSGRTSDFHGHPFSVHGFYDWRNWAIATAICSEGDTLVEIGANVGTETVGFRDIVGRRGRVFAFEPVPENFASLRTQVALNRWENVHVYSYALADMEGQIVFALPPNKHASGIGHLVGHGGSGSSRTIEVQCRSLDSLAEQIGPAKAIFCDTEGAEVKILQGARQYLGRFKPVVVLEASPKLLARMGSSLSELLLSLSSQSYEAFEVCRFGVHPVVGVNQTKAGNWLCVHTSLHSLASKCSRMIARCALLPRMRGINPLCR